MLSKRIRAQLLFYAFGLVVVVLLYYVFDLRSYLVKGASIWLAVSLAGTFGIPPLARWYTSTSDRARLTACAAAIVVSGALISMYVKDFVLQQTPQSALHWLAVAFILFFPTAILYMASAEARRVLKGEYRALQGQYDDQERVA